MKYTVLFLLFSLISFSSSSQSVDKGSQLYRVYFTKYKHGKANEAMEIGMKYFKQGLEKTGQKVIALKGITGQYDAIIITEVNDENPLQNQKQAEFEKNMLEIAGSQDKLIKELKRYEELIAEEETAYFRNEIDSELSPSEIYKIHDIQFNNVNKNEGMRIGLKYFDASLRHVGVNSLVLRSVTSKGRALIVTTASTDHPFELKNQEEFSKNLMTIAGNSAKLSKDMDNYDNSVDHEIINYYRILKK